MKKEFISQYAHTWRVFIRLVNDFDDTSWIHTGRGATIPAKLSFHILKSTKYYMENESVIAFASGKTFDIDCATAKEDELPSRSDMIDCIHVISKKTEAWLTNLDYAALNEAFPWAGATKLAVALFLLRHFLYHLGELSSLLNECRDGNVEDNYVKALEGNL
jgi:hypothetical protein